MLNKKAISPVVATALLLVVAVTAVVGFGSWYDTYSSSMFVGAETRTNSAGSISIEHVGNNGILYVKNSGTNNITIDSVEISNVDCDLNQSLAPGVNSVDISSCLDESGSNDVVITTPSGIIEKEFYISEEIISESLSSGPIYTDTFISVWNTSESGTPNNQISLPLEATGTYNFTVTGSTLVGSPVQILVDTDKVLNFTSNT